MSLTLYLPKREDLWFRQSMLEDAETMSYNHAYGGTISFPKTRWASWYDKWVASNDKDRFYRYLQDEEGRFVGEVAYHFDADSSHYLADVLIFARYRNKGFGGQALDLLCQVAKDHGVKVIYDEIAVDNPAIAMFLRHGFIEVIRGQESVLLRKNL